VSPFGPPRLANCSIPDLRQLMKDPVIFGYRCLAQALVFTLALQAVGWSADTQTLPTALSIVDVQGEGATGRIRQRTSVSPAIRVVDENRNPIRGAAVVFTLPTEGATGVFGNGEKTLTVVTDERGSAAAPALRFNDVPGNVQVHINVSYKGLTARSSITQKSEAPAGYKPDAHHGGSGKLIAVLLLVAAGGAGGAVFATRKGGSSSTSTPAGPPAIGITPGTGTIAPPR
jgi:hypothetical protein